MDFSYLNNQIHGNPSTSTQPKLSICVITYNHEAYIEKCLENILHQEVNFEYEIIIGEDHSTDQTAQIVKKYAEMYPKLIKAYIRPKNVGAKINFLHCFFDCQGEYIVHIEADDYFTDPHKLQCQVDFLENHPEASACFHNAEIIYEDETARKPELINRKDQKKWIETQDFFVEKETWFMATASVMMRKKFVKSLPEWFFNCKSGDIPLYSILAEQGPIGYIDKIMSVYRKNSNGMSYTDHTHSIEFIKNRIFMYAHINEYTKGKYQYLIKAILFDYYILGIHCSKIKKSVFLKLYYLWLAYRQIPPKNKKQVFSDIKLHVMESETRLSYLNFRSKLNSILGRSN